MTGPRPGLRLSQQTASEPAPALTTGAPGWRVTEPPSCPTLRASQPPPVRVSAPRVERDSHLPGAALGSSSAAPGPRPGTRARLSPADGAQACAVASAGRSDRTPSGSRPLRPPVRTTSGTSYTAGGARSICPFPEAAVGKLNSRNPGASWITIPPPQSARERRRVDHYAAAGWITRRAPLKRHRPRPRTTPA